MSRNSKQGASSSQEPVSSDSKLRVISPAQQKELSYLFALRGHATALIEAVKETATLATEAMQLVQKIETFRRQVESQITSLNEGRALNASGLEIAQVPAPMKETAQSIEHYIATLRSSFFVLQTEWRKAPKYRNRKYMSAQDVNSFTAESAPSNTWHTSKSEKRIAHISSVRALAKVVSSSLKVDKNYSSFVE